MDRLDEVLQALKQSLITGGVSAAVISFEAGRKLRYSMPVVTVGIEKCSYGHASFLNYLGLRLDETTQMWEELYGKRLEIKFGLDIYVPRDLGTAEYARVFDELCSAVSDLPCGLRALELSCGEASFDEATGMLHGTARLDCAVYLCATEKSDGLFSDFRLRGVIINGNH